MGLELRARNALELKIPRSFQNVKGYPRRKVEKKKREERDRKNLWSFYYFLLYLIFFPFDMFLE